MGAQQILDAISREAVAECDGIIRTAEQTVAQARDAALAQAQKKADAISKKADDDAVEAEKRRMLTAGIEARKNSLAARRELLERAFDKAHAELCSLEGAEYVSLITALVTDAAASGDEKLSVPANVAERYTKPYNGKKTMLETLNEALVKAGKKGNLTLCSEPGSFEGGVKLIGKITDIDCSFASLISSYRDTNETEVSRLLFHTEV